MRNNLNKKWKLEDLIPLIEKADASFQIDEQELLQYAQHIGIELPQQQYMLFVAKEGMKQNLPPQWKAFRTPSQQFQMVYRNMQTGQIRDEHPLDQQYRLRVIMLRKQIQNQQNQQYSQSASLSQIAEEQNQMGNDSQVYDRRKPSIPKQSLRQPITKEGIRQITETHNRQLSKLSQNSVIQKNISENSNSNSKKDKNTKIMPSSFLQNHKSLQNPLLEQYRAQFTHKNNMSEQQSQQSSNSLGDQLRDEINRVKELKQRLIQLQQQQKLKQHLLLNLQQSNNKLLQKIYKRIKREDKKHNKG